MAPRGLKVTLFHLFFVPIVWAVVLYMAVRTEYEFSLIQSIWMGVDLLAAIIFRIVVTMELIWGLEIALLRLPNYDMSKLALSAICGVIQFFNEWTFIGAMLLLAQKILVEKILVLVLLYFGSIGTAEMLAEGGQYWCFLMFLLIGYYELVAFFVLVFLRIRAELQAGGPERTKLQAGPECTELQADPEGGVLQADPERASVSVATV